VGDHLVLVGMMGAGKSTVGALVSERLGRRHVDADAEVEAASGCTVAELFAARGEPAFRALEAAVLDELLAAPEPAVVAVGGGAVLDPHNRMLMARSGTVVWLRATPATLAARVGDGAGRPLLAGAAAENLSRLDHDRRGLYEEVAVVTVDVDDLTPAQVAEKILAALP
jgi:shikimate kinase